MKKQIRKAVGWALLAALLAIPFVRAYIEYGPAMTAALFGATALFVGLIALGVWLAVGGDDE